MQLAPVVYTHRAYTARWQRRTGKQVNWAECRLRYLGAHHSPGVCLQPCTSFVFVYPVTIVEAVEEANVGLTV